MPGWSDTPGWLWLGEAALHKDGAANNSCWSVIILVLLCQSGSAMGLLGFLKGAGVRVVVSQRRHAVRQLTMIAYHVLPSFRVLLCHDGASEDCNLGLGCWIQPAIVTTAWYYNYLLLTRRACEQAGLA